MILVFILLGIIIFILSITIILLLSIVQIEIKNLKIGNKEHFNNSRIKDEYEIKITLYFLEKIPIIWSKLNNRKLRKIYTNSNLQKVDFSKLKGKAKFDKDAVEMIKNIKIKVSKLKLRIDLGLEDAIITSYLIAIISSIIGIILPHIVEKNKLDNISYNINPIYKNKNEYQISLNCIIRIKIVHIIYNIVCFIEKKGRDVKNERPSNRRTYAYRYE